MKLLAVFVNTQNRVASVLLSAMALLAVTTCPVWAEGGDTFTPYVRGQYGYDSNLFRLQNDQQAISILGRSSTAESYYQLAAGLGADVRFSRQSVKAKVEFNRTEFNTYTALDYDGRDIALKWDWLAGSAASGDIGIEEKLTQASYGNVKQPVSNLVRTRRGFFRSAIQLGNPWQMKFGLDRTRTSNDATTQLTQDATVDSVNAGVQYQSPKGSTVEFMSRYMDGSYPNRQVVGLTSVKNDYRQWDNGVSLAWAPTGKTALAGTLNYTRRSYAEVAQRDFSGLTGLLSLDWMITGKTTLKASLHRDIGAIDNTTASYTLNQGVLLGADWKPTAKLVINTQLRYDNIDYAGEPGLVLSAREDQLTTMQAKVQYAVLRNTQVGLWVQRGIRHSSESLSSYNYNSAHVSLRHQF